MTPLVDLTFGITFGFARPVPATARAVNGAIVTVAANAPRFDHDVTGRPLGLLVTPGPAFGQHDAVTAKPGDWEPQYATVLHHFDGGGWGGDGPERRALFTLRARDAVTACLGQAGHHREILVVPQYLTRHVDAAGRGFVRWGALAWYLAGALGDDAGRAVADGGGRPLLEG